MPTCEGRHFAVGGSLKTKNKKFKFQDEADFEGAYNNVKAFIAHSFQSLPQPLQPESEEPLSESLLLW